MAYTTLSLIEEELKLSSGSLNASSLPSSTTITTWIEQADDKINTKTGNLYAETLVSSEEFDWENNDDILHVEPFTSITSLHYSGVADGTTPSWTAKTEDTDFYSYGEEGEIRFIRANFNPVSGHRRFLLTYTKGQATVPPQIQEVSTLLVANHIVRATVGNQAAEQSGGSVQVGTIKIEDPTAFSVGAYRSREQEVKSFFDEDIGTKKAFRVSRAYDL